MEDIIEKLTTSTYKTLKQMYDSQVRLPDGTVYVPLSQAELSRIIGVSTITMNATFKYLFKNDLVHPYGTTKGRYYLTDMARIIVENIEILDERIKEIR